MTVLQIGYVKRCIQTMHLFSMLVVVVSGRGGNGSNDAHGGTSLVINNDMRNVVGFNVIIAMIIFINIMVIIFITIVSDNEDGNCIMGNIASVV